MLDTTHPLYVMKEWLTVKIEKTNLNNSRAHLGFVTIKGNREWETKLVPSLTTAVMLLTQRFSSSKTGGDYGFTKLTEATIAIGKLVAQYYVPHAVTVDIHLNLGNVFLGALYNHGYIDIGPDEGYSQFSQSTPYVITMLATFENLANIPPEAQADLLKGTSATPIPDVTNIIQGNNRPLIKEYIQGNVEDLKAALINNDEWLQAVNKIQKVGWRINQGVYKILCDKFDEMIVIPPPRPMIGSKKAVDDALEILKAPDGNTKQNRDKYNRAVKLWNKEVEVLKQLSKNAEIRVTKAKAEALAAYEEFYQYVELDYRGRVYYYEPTLNYQGPDIARGLLEFSEGKVLNRDGLRWLAIHTAASYNKTYNIDEIPEWVTSDYKGMLEEKELDSISVDKFSLNDRERWTWENLEWIATEATESLQVKAEKPVVFLACCLEWSGYAEDPEGFISHLPVPIDGSCNGYQHSAAISRDERTGALVSLTDTEIPEDLYVEAAKSLTHKVPEFFEARPDMKMKHIRKGVAKRAVMTRAYSAGKEKISEHMYQDCHSEGFTDMFDIDMLDCHMLGGEMYELIKEVCPGATKTMGFLQDLVTFQVGTFATVGPDGKTVSRGKKKRKHGQKQKLKKIKEPTKEDLIALNEISQEIEGWSLVKTRGIGTRTVNWKTPSGFRVRYECFLDRDRKIKATIPGYTGGASGQSGRITFVIKEVTNYPDLCGYQSGISPNWIHGEDAAHMCCIVSSWDAQFAGVHDSFSTHANDVQALQDFTKEVFVKQYSTENPFQDIVDRLLDGDEKYDKELPTLGSLEIQDVLKSQYFFC